MAIGHPRSCSITDRIPLFCVRRREAVEECYSGLAIDVTVRKGASSGPCGGPGYNMLPAEYFTSR